MKLMHGLLMIAVSGSVCDETDARLATSIAGEYSRKVTEHRLTLKCVKLPLVICLKPKC